MQETQYTPEEGGEEKKPDKNVKLSRVECMMQEVSAVMATAWFEAEKKGKQDILSDLTELAEELKGEAKAHDKESSEIVDRGGSHREWGNEEAKNNVADRIEAMVKKHIGTKEKDKEEK